ncbi:MULTISPECIES: (2Fe-2S)-binding protein [Clostridium]|uniref:Bacterioferritin-associated ferredoxin n=1 Tax=Clostridium sulfidigenes TaxID=318464 RepID=A0A084JCW0_9CLOT|nr:(2Fe-2S)-binding protein [Clostridium sulfidigenes]KEZ86794.1 (2Fe-2S)-binding protein [Clostridium sulfidigenes]HBA03828.1 (2Fe-2S)-binding protein [Clostridium sp.]HBL07252.1 (2Fe-2S)-binding protein [Clostridium sp.]
MSENRIICTCQDVDYNTIKKAIEDGAKTVDDIMEATGAGTVCGGCISEIEEILQEVKK